LPKPELGAADAARLAFCDGASTCSGNMSSRKPIAQQYDQSVQGNVVLAPYTVVGYECPNYAAVLRPIPGKPYGAVFSHAVNPIWNQIDPYWGAIMTVVQALARYAAVGGNVAEGELALIDNFIWPVPDEEELGALDQSVDGCVKGADTFRLAFVSGKDSLSGTYKSLVQTLKNSARAQHLCLRSYTRRHENGNG